MLVKESSSAMRRSQSEAVRSWLLLLKVMFQNPLSQFHLEKHPLKTAKWCLDLEKVLKNWVVPTTVPSFCEKSGYLELWKQMRFSTSIYSAWNFYHLKPNKSLQWANILCACCTFICPIGWITSKKFTLFFLKSLFKYNTPSVMLWYVVPRVCIFKIPFFSLSSEPIILSNNFDIDIKEWKIKQLSDRL